MIPLNELRIGNRVTEDVLGVVKVDAIETYGLWVEAINMKTNKELERVRYLINYEHINPIPLTPELLDKCGLGFGHPQLVTEDSVVTIVDMLMVHKHDNGNVSLSVVFMSMPDSYKGKPIRKAEIKSFHQLQNLHFALTGEELNDPYPEPSKYEEQV